MAKKVFLRQYRCPDYIRRALRALRPPESMTVSQWAERYRSLDAKTSAEPGPWANERTPYLVDIMNELTSPESEEIVFVKPTQVGGTEAMNNMLGWVITSDPSPVEVVYPTEELAESVSSKRLQPMIMASRPLRDKYDPTSKLLELDFSDMFVKIVGSNSPVGVASFAMKYLFIDEIDKFPGASKKEADPVSLAEERTKTFRGRKIFKTSTPTLKTGHIWRAKESADVERHFFVPCPHCGVFIELRFAQLRWPGRGRDFVDVYGAEGVRERLEELSAEGGDLSDSDRADLAVYICQECGAAITEQQKQVAIRYGRWEDVERRARRSKRVCYWLNTLYSPFVTFSEVAKKFMDSKGDSEKLQNFVNSWLAEPWEDTRLRTSAELVLDRQTDIPAYTVPGWAKLLTGGVDVQQDCLYWTIRAFGDYITSQNVAHGQAISFAEVELAMNALYVKPDGGQMPVAMCLVDSGNDTDSVYDFCAENAEWAYPVKGSSHDMDSHYRLSTVNKAGSKANGLTLVIVDGGKYKDMIASRLQKPCGRGSWMVYRGCDMEYAQQVTAEQKIAERSGSKIVQRWKPKISHAQNHYLDCEVYALAAADILGVRTLHLMAGAQAAPQQSPKRDQPSPEEEWSAKNDWT